jgi:ATP adenylyltransferase
MPKTIFKRLSEFISTKMRMSHIYQPVMIRELLVRGGAASVDEIAASLLAHDPSQVEYYGLRTKNMVGKPNVCDIRCEQRLKAQFKDF